ncbi:hypothetical protein M0R45_016733 [Rubus argutus]|uniref:Protein kinase domain-containing protein n=1 Tax=Rubus argutus TaxID=59490 RepID=A0AAW1XTK1_RUBAR
MTNDFRDKLGQGGFGSVCKGELSSGHLVAVKMTGSKGRSKNKKAYAEHSSQIDFPCWIHEQLEKGLNIEIEYSLEYENKIAKKMIMVALWCIQWMPVNRPSMTKVLEMLESEGEAWKCLRNLSLVPRGANRGSNG